MTSCAALLFDDESRGGAVCCGGDICGQQIRNHRLLQ
jgi:hypothetical protein